MPRGKGEFRTQNPFLHLHLYSKFSWEGSIEPIHSGFPREVPLTRGLVFYPGKSCATWKASLPNVNPHLSLSRRQGLTADGPLSDLAACRLSS